jgi:transposase-like protein
VGCSPDSLCVWMLQVQRDGGERPGQTTAAKLRIIELEREVRDLRQANEILRITVEQNALRQTRGGSENMILKV